MKKNSSKIRSAVKLFQSTEEWDGWEEQKEEEGALSSAASSHQENPGGFSDVKHARTAGSIQSPDLPLMKRLSSRPRGKSHPLIDVWWDVPEQYAVKT